MVDLPRPDGPMTATNSRRTHRQVHAPERADRRPVGHIALAQPPELADAAPGYSANRRRVSARGLVQQASPSSIPPNPASPAAERAHGRRRVCPHARRAPRRGPAGNRQAPAQLNTPSPAQGGCACAWAGRTCPDITGGRRRPGRWGAAKTSATLSWELARLFQRIRRSPGSARRSRAWAIGTSSKRSSGAAHADDEGDRAVWVSGSLDVAAKRMPNCNGTGTGIRVKEPRRSSCVGLPVW